MKKNQRIMGFTLMFLFVISMFCVIPSKVEAAPAPSLTSVEIIDLALDDNDQIHIVVREIGTSRAGTGFAWWNGSFCSENINERVTLWGSDNIAYGYIKYYSTGVYYSSSLSGSSVLVKAQATNAMNPWNTISTSTSFIIP